MIFMGKSMVSWRFSLKSTHWTGVSLNLFTVPRNQPWYLYKDSMELLINELVFCYPWIQKKGKWMGVDGIWVTRLDCEFVGSNPFPRSCSPPLSHRGGCCSWRIWWMRWMRAVIIYQKWPIHYQSGSVLSPQMIKMWPETWRVLFLEELCLGWFLSRHSSFRCQKVAVHRSATRRDWLHRPLKAVAWQVVFICFYHTLSITFI